MNKSEWLKRINDINECITNQVGSFFCIKNKKNNYFWMENFGWSKDSCSVFSPEEKKCFSLPMHGEWENIMKPKDSLLWAKSLENDEKIIISNSYSNINKCIDAKKDINNYIYGSDNKYNISELNLFFEKNNIFSENFLYLGSGYNGEAYFDKKSGKVIKLSNDEEEIKLAKLLKGKINSFIVNIYDILYIPHIGTLILQEKVDTKNKKLIFEKNKILKIINKKEIVFQDLINEYQYEEAKKILGNNISEYGFKILESAYFAKNEIQKLTNNNSIKSDIHLFNIGIREGSNICFFDQRF